MRQIREWVSDSGKRIVRLYERDDRLFWFEEVYEAFDEYAGFFGLPDINPACSQLPSWPKPKFVPSQVGSTDVATAANHQKLPPR